MNEHTVRTNPITLCEYEFLHCSDRFNPEHRIDAKTFTQLESFVLNNPQEAGVNKANNDDVSQFLKLTSKRGYKVLQAQNYVGVLQTRDGTTIEILPKIGKVSDDDGSRKKSQEKSRAMLLKMLATLRQSNFKNSQFANLNTAKLPLFEIFIQMFLDELSLMIKKGIRSNYVQHFEPKSPFLKGKLKVVEQIRHNAVNQSNFAVEYEQFTRDIVPNQLIKTALNYLQNKTKSAANQKRLLECRFVFDEVTPCHDIKGAFAKLAQQNTNRSYKHYDNVLSWCKVFLLDRSFSPFKGDEVAWALLFDMNRLFEDFVAHHIKKQNPDKHVKTQDKRHHLCYQNGSGKFDLRPDIVMDADSDGIEIIDTKWKILSESKYTVSQSDAYQMFAYAMKYEKGEESRACQKVTLLYPAMADASQQVRDYAFYQGDKTKTLHICFFNLDSCEICKIRPVSE